MKLKELILKIREWWIEYKAREPQRKEDTIERLKYRAEVEKYKASIRTSRSKGRPNIQRSSLGSGSGLNYHANNSKSFKEPEPYYNMKYKEPEPYKSKWKTPKG